TQGKRLETTGLETRDKTDRNLAALSKERSGARAICFVARDCYRHQCSRVGRYDPQNNLMCAGWTTNRSLGGGIFFRTAWLLGAYLCRFAVPDIRLYDWRDVAWQRSCRRFSGANDVAVHGADGFSYQSSCRVRSLRYQIGSAQADTRRGLTSLGHDARLMPRLFLLYSSAASTSTSATY